MRFAIFLLEITIVLGIVYVIYKAITVGKGNLEDRYNESKKQNESFKKFKDQIKKDE